MLGRYPRDCLVRNHSYEGVVMKTIDKATIRQYQGDALALWVWVMLAIPPMVVGMALCCLADRKSISDAWWPWGFLALAVGMAIFLVGGVSMADDKAHAEREKSWQYKLLDRWVEWSDQPLSMFPTSNIGSKYLELWAIKELTSRAQLLNERYSREEDFYNQEKKIDWEMLALRGENKPKCSAPSGKRS